ncbi:hypothetical protein Ciccas_007333, partial [Cichlidogyrus casuarinus]
MNLSLLDLSYNKIQLIPSETENLNVEELIMDRNPLRLITKELAKSKTLKTLRLKSTQLDLATFPAELLTDSVICTIDISENSFSFSKFQAITGYEA